MTGRQGGGRGGGRGEGRGGGRGGGRGVDPDEDLVRVRARDAGELAAMLPFVLGYHPRRSLVAVLFDGRRLQMSARLDLPPPDTPEDELRAAAAALAGPVAREPGDHVVLLAYEDVLDESCASGRALEDAFDDEDLEVTRGIVVRDGRWFGCLDGVEPHPEGHEVPSPDEVPAVAELVALGRTPAASRDELEARLVPTAGDPFVEEVRVALRRLDLHPSAPGAAFGLAEGGGSGSAGRGPAATAGRRRSRRRTPARTAELLAPWGRLLRDPGGPDPTWDPDEVAAMSAVLRDLEVRDAVVAHLCPGTLPDHALDARLRATVRRVMGPVPWHPNAAGSAREVVAAEGAVVERLCGIARHLPDGDAAPVLTVTANLTWWLGDGALSRTLLERAVDLEPDHRLALLLLRMVDHSLRPEGYRRSTARTPSP